MIFEIVKTGLLCAAGILSAASCVVAFIAYKTNQEDPDNEEYP